MCSATCCSSLRYARRALAHATDTIRIIVKRTVKRGNRSIGLLLHGGLRAHREGVRATHTRASPLRMRMLCSSYVHSSCSWTVMCSLYTTSTVALLPSTTEPLEVGEQEGMREETRGRAEERCGTEDLTRYKCQYASPTHIPHSLA